MPYVRRDVDGALISLHRDPEFGALELLPDLHPEVQAFLGHAPEPGFAQLDAQFIRVLEDVIDLLIRRNVINLTDLPAAAQHKLLSRKDQRAPTPLSELNLLGEDGGTDSAVLSTFSQLR